MSPEILLVNGSANMFSVLMYYNSISFFIISSWINLYLKSMCLHLPLKFVSWAITIHTLTIILNFISWLNISLNKFLNHKACLVHSVKLTNSASTVDKLMFFCNWDFHEIWLFPSKNIYPLVDLLIFSSLVKSESEYPINLLSLL